MKIDTLLKFKEPFDKFRDIETKLLSRNTKGKIAGWGALLSAVVQVVILLLQEDIIGKLMGLFSEPVQINLRIFIPGLLTVIGLIIYFLIRRTGFLMKETKEPFRYTFWVESFTRIDSTPADRFVLKAEDRLKLMNHDLIELIHQRIKRFSILEEGSAEEAKRLTDTRLSSHIHIHGTYAIREDRENNEWIIHVMPFIRIGQKGSAETLAQSVRFPLIETPDTLDTDEYHQLLERVYSRITTEIYARIEQDIERKIDLFPTAYLQSNALYVEAYDMAASNTINAFDSAIKLYQSAIRKIELTLSFSASGLFLSLPLLRNFFTRYLYQYARIQIGHAQCLIYKNRIASLSGRKSNPLFEIKQNLRKTILRLEKYHIRLGKDKSLKSYKNDRKTYSILSYLSFPKDSILRFLLLRPGSTMFKETCDILFHAYIVESLTDSLTGSYKSARKYLEKARAVAPDLSTSDVLFYLAEAYCESDIDKALMIFQHAAELDPSFQIARYDLAFWMEMKFRANAEITPERAKNVLHEYDKVLQINPGNIAALTAQGNLLWLLGDLNKALRKFNEGCNLKAIVSETFIAQLLYGKARVLAENGSLNDSLELFSQAIANNPNVGAYSMNNEKGITVTYYDYISKSLVGRYRKYQKTVAEQKTSSSSLLEKSLSFANNDLANACMNYFIRFGDEKYLKEAIDLYATAIQLNAFNSVAIYNKSNALTFSSNPDDSEESMLLLQKVTENNPRWLEALTSSIELIQQESFRKIKDARIEIKSLEKKLFQFARKTDPLTFSAGTSLSPNQSSGPGMGSDIKSPESLLLLQSSQLEKQRIKDSIEKLQEEKQAQIARLASLKPLLRRVFETSKLISLYDGLALESFEPQSVNTLLNLKINWVRLDLEDVRALRNYAISSYYNLVIPEDFTTQTQTNFPGNINEPDKARQLCRKLLQHLRNYYYAEDFVIIRLLQDLIQEEEAASEFNQLFFSCKVSDYTRKLLKDLQLSNEIRACFLNESLQINNYELSANPSGINSWTLSFESSGTWRNFLIKLKGRKIEVLQMEAEYYTDLIRGTIRFWNGEDPIHWNYLNWAERYLSNNEYTLILENADRLTENPVLFALLGSRYFDNEEYEKSAQSFLRVIEWDEALPVHYYKLGLSYARMQDSDQAVTYMQKAIVQRRKIAEDNHDLYFYYNELLTLLISIDKPEMFIKLIDKSKDLSDQPEQLALLYNRAGNAFSDQRKWHEAGMCYKKASGFNPAQPIYFSNQALMHVNEDHPEKAHDLYIKAINLRRKNNNDSYTLGYYYSQLARVYYQSGDPDSFFSFAEQTGDFASLDLIMAELYNTMGVFYSNDTYYQEAIPYFEKAAGLDPEKPIYSSNLALMHSNLKEWESAVTIFRKVLDLIESTATEAVDVEYYYSLAADAFYYHQKFDEFIQRVSKSASLNKSPEKKALVMNRAGNLYAVDPVQKSDAISYYKEAIALDPQLPIFSCNLAYVYAGLQDWQEAWQSYKAAIEKRRVYQDTNYSMEYYFGLAVDSYFMAGHLDEFLSYSEMITDGPISSTYKAVIFNQIGNLYSGQALQAQAVQFYRKAIELDAEIPIYHNNLGLMYQSLENWSDAIECFIKTIHLRRTATDDPYNFEYYYKQGAKAYYRAGRISEFLQMAESGGDFESDATGLASVYNATGNLYHGSSETRKALEFYEKAVNLDPDAAVYRSNIGVMHAVLRNWKQAAEYQEEAIEVALQQKATDDDLVYYAKLLGESYGQLNLMENFGEKLTTLKLTVDDLKIILSGLEIYFRDENLNDSADWCKERINELR